MMKRKKERKKESKKVRERKKETAAYHKKLCPLLKSNRLYKEKNLLYFVELSPFQMRFGVQ